MGKVTIDGLKIDDKILEVAINADNISSPVIGTAFYLNIPDNLTFLSYLEGNFLERGGDPIYLVKEKDGKIIFGASLKKGDNYPLNSGTIVKFRFEINKGEIFNFHFQNSQVSLVDTIAQEMDKVEFVNSVIDLTNQNQEIGEISKYKGAGTSDKSTFKFMRYWYVSLILPVMIYLIYMLKKPSMKSHGRYVNFK